MPPLQTSGGRREFTHPNAEAEAEELRIGAPGWNAPSLPPNPLGPAHQSLRAATRSRDHNSSMMKRNNSAGLAASAILLFLSSCEGGSGSGMPSGSSGPKEIAIGAYSGFPREWSTGETSVTLAGDIVDLDGVIPATVIITRAGATNQSFATPVSIHPVTGAGEWRADVALEEGDNVISVDAPDGFYNVDPPYYRIAYNPGYTFSSPLKATPSSFELGTAPLQVTVGVDLPRTLSGGVNLYIDNEDAPPVMVGQMYDDGDPSHGDAIAEDGIYSILWDGSLQVLGVTRLRAEAVRSDTAGSAWSERLRVVISAPLDLDLIAAEDALWNELHVKIDAAAAAGNLQDVVDDIYIRLQSSSLVTGVYKLDDPPSLSVTFASGIGALIAPLGTDYSEKQMVEVRPLPQSPSGQTATHASSASPAPAQVGSTDVLSLALYKFDFGPFEEGLAMSGLIGGMPCMDELPGVIGAGCYDGSIESFKRLSGPGVALVTTHGAIARDDWKWWFPVPHYFEILFTNVKLTPEIREQYKADFDCKRLWSGRVLHCDGEGPMRTVAITPEFIRTYVNFPESIVYVGGCRAFRRGDFKSACFEKGAACYISYTDDVYSGWAYPRALQFATNLAMTGSVAASFIAGQVQTDCPPSRPCPPAEFEMRFRPGLSDITLPLACDGTSIGATSCAFGNHTTVGPGQHGANTTTLDGEGLMLTEVDLVTLKCFENPQNFGCSSSLSECSWRLTCSLVHDASGEEVILFDGLVFSGLGQEVEIRFSDGSAPSGGLIGGPFPVSIQPQEPLAGLVGLPGGGQVTMRVLWTIPPGNDVAGTSVEYCFTLAGEGI